jgi:hypothetical protein
MSQAPQACVYTDSTTSAFFSGSDIFKDTLKKELWQPYPGAF